MADWVVHKFGGTSVANAERYRKVAAILDDPAICPRGPRKAVVVSAMSKITDKLIRLLELARKQDETYLTELDAIRAQHQTAVKELLDSAPARARLGAAIDSDCAKLRELLRAVYLSRTYSELTLELIAGHGEIWSAQLLAAHLAEKGRPVSWLDARQVLVVRPGETGVVVDWETSKPKLQAWLKANAQETVVITGYVASDPEGVATTLKRNGSDFSASIFAALSDAKAITIWTDVDGVLSADPNRVPEAVVLDEMSYNEAIELAYFGAKVIHPDTMAPALEHGIPIWIRNTFNPTHPGTQIHEKPEGVSKVAVKGFSTMDKVALINLEGTGMIGVPGVAQRLFGALREVGVSVIMISQASSEHSICFVVPEAQGALAKEAAEKAFFAELHHGQVQTVGLFSGCSVLAAVGDQMARTPGTSARFFGALGKAGVNIRAIAQGSSERNISVVVDAADSTRALRAVHSGFFLSDQTLSIGLVGPGLIGGALLRQLEAQAPLLREQFRIDLRVRAITSSRQMLLGDPRIDLKDWKNSLSAKGQAPDPAKLAAHVKPDHLPHAVMIDCTSSGECERWYPAWLRSGIHVITPNKKANSGSMALYRELQQLGRKLNTHYFYEATVGAGLPVITTLRDLIRTGDQVLKIEGVLSGTLSYLFNSFGEGKSFSSIVKQAREQGYTEPDPRDDLSGLDFARKLIILGREMGLALELGDVHVESLVPKPLRQVSSVDEFLARLPEFDAEIARVQAEAKSASEVLRYIGEVSPEGGASVKLRRIPAAHPFARVQGTDNIIAFTTTRYRTQPLIVQGPGAGPDVTAGGIFADLLRLVNYLGGPL